ncbi:kinase suppressor of Ras 2-like [Saccoglossus kowalevskii]|uniref:Kinase suppressor of Ras 2-like n=1 Tax=Saccoglossus kowalevskii TaxID=10224 RepID=A0ABM0MPF4_SACKO|nr:PREDICTED: kinase suppressor of Ras 2-like [Saccoglossus kowalevskii]
MSGGDPTPKGAWFECLTIQTVINSQLSLLAGLRTQCHNSSLTIQKEIRQAESKLLSLFCKQLAIKTEAQHNGVPSADIRALESYPKLEQWLEVVDINKTTAKDVCSRLKKLESLIDLPDTDINKLLSQYGAAEREARRLVNARKLLKKAISGIAEGESVSDLHVDHWNGDLESCPVNLTGSPKQHRLSTTFNPFEQFIPPPTPPATSNENHPNAIWKISPPPTPSSMVKKGKMPSKGTPPPKKKLVVPENNLKRSKSDETSLLYKVNSDANSRNFKKPTNLKMPGIVGGSHEVLSKRRRSVESDSDAGASSGQSSPRKNSPARTPPTPHHFIHDKHDLLARSQNALPGRPRSPRTPTKSMIHSINHRFTKKTFLIPQNCDYCGENVMFKKGYRCKECKYVCHAKCEIEARKLPSCGLPDELEKEFRNEMTNPAMRQAAAEATAQSGHGINNNPSVKVSLSPNDNGNYLYHMESSSNPSSTTSSTPSSPAHFATSSTTSSISSPAQPSPLTRQTHFDFPEPNNKLTIISSTTIDSEILLTPTPIHIPVESRCVDQNELDTDSERTLPSKVDSIDSQASDFDPLDQSWSRKSKTSVFSEWDIPYEDMHILELIGRGRLGKVFKGYWHGDVAIKQFNIDTDNELQLHSFKQEVQTFRKTRHENVVLFMGACMNPPHLAIVTSLCKGSTLYSPIHVWKETFNLQKSVLIATQIAQGMGYLHARGIVHKDLKSKNIFLENRDKAVITDFGLFSVTKLCEADRRGNCIRIPEGWLCYLAPELITSLKITNLGLDNELPFSKSSDVYSFGTVWYELLAGEWTFNNQPAQSIIWQVGKGIKQSLGHLQASRDVKEILMMCWSYHPESRPTFGELMKALDRLRLPKKRLARSPSHPLHLSRSAESVL